jgi:protocatechuate 3,4-dioxygenase beta subunit
MILISAALLAGAFQQQPQEQTKPAVEEKKASIEGTVIELASGKPLKGVNLMLIRSTPGSRGGTTSDEAGHFIFKDLEAGTYMLVANHPRYGTQMYGARPGTRRGMPVSLAAGQELKGIDFKLQSTAVISGKVVDEDGEPLKGVMVAAVQSFYRRGGRQLAPAGPMNNTNDLGEFRISNVAEGKYVVVAILMKQGEGKPAEDGTEPAYLPTYYPNSPDPSGAAMVSVTAGAEAGGTDIRLIKTKAVRVKGKVLGITASQRLSVRLTQKSGGMLQMMSGRGAMVKAADGSFEITAVTPGSYVLRVMDVSARGAAGVSVPLEVGDKPVSGVTVEFTMPPDLNGEVVFDGEQSQKPALKGQRIFLEATDEAAMGGMAVVNEDGTFQMKGVGPGKYFVRLMPAPEGTYVSSVMLGGQRMGEDGLEIPAGGAGKLEIKPRPGAAQIEGTVQDAEGKPVTGASVALIPKSKSYLLYQTAATDQKGAFSFRGVTPEDYLLLAVEDMEPGAQFDPEFLKLYESKAEKIVLKENDRKGVALKLIPKQ